MTLNKNKRIKIVMAGLVVFAVGTIAYFNAVVTPRDLNGVQSNAGMANEDAAAPYLAQFKADCSLNDGRKLSGNVSVKSTETPDTLDRIELVTEAGQTVTFNKTEGACEFSPY